MKSIKRGQPRRGLSGLLGDQAPLDQANQLECQTCRRAVGGESPDVFSKKRRAPRPLDRVVDNRCSIQLGTVGWQPAQKDDKFAVSDR